MPTTNTEKKSNADVVREIAEKLGLSQVMVKSVLDAECEIVARGLSDGVEVTAMGGALKFSAKERAARKGRNPRTGEVVDIPATTVVTAKPLSKLKSSVK